MSCGPQLSAGARRIQDSSVEPPPMSNSSARRASPWYALAPCSKGEQLSSASSASSRVEITSIGRPVSWRTRSRNSRPLLARRQASVAMARRPRTGRRVRRWAQACRAPRARSIARSLSRPVACRPSPRRTMRLKLSSTRKPSGVGAPTSRRQLLVPRSNAANAGAGGRPLSSIIGAAVAGIGVGRLWQWLSAYHPLFAQCGASGKSNQCLQCAQCGGSQLRGAAGAC